MTTIACSDVLRDYVLALVQAPIGRIDPRHVAIRDVGPIATITLHRAPPFQAELVLVKPGGQGFPEHRHPNVDSVEIVLSGDIRFTRNGAPEPLCDGWPALVAEGRLGLIGIPHTDWHGAAVGPDGAAFISCQHWLNGVEPTTVGADWDGDALGPRHEAVWAAEGRTESLS
jgi:hypothetical protein